MSVQKIAGWIKSEVREAGAKGIVVGLSGGIDSSVVAVLSKMGMGENVIGVIMPCNSNPMDLEHAVKLSDKFGIKTIIINLEDSYNALLKTLPKSEKKIAGANLKPRLRMAALYYVANMHNYLVAGTGNKTEIMIGYFTKYGDGGVDIEPIGDLYKTDVRKIAWELGIPDGIIEKPPSAGLWEGQTDENEMGITYDELDKILKAIEKGRTEGLDKEKLKKVREMIRKSEHKRHVPKTCKIDD